MSDTERLIRFKFEFERLFTEEEVREGLDEKYAYLLGMPDHELEWKIIEDDIRKPFEIATVVEFDRGRIQAQVLRVQRRVEEDPQEAVEKLLDNGHDEDSPHLAAAREAAAAASGDDNTAKVNEALGFDQGTGS